tara:strand:- start:471 stop:860 length:390 start_codon:yes stop_codon:yes gene_type:complete
MLEYKTQIIKLQNGEDLIANVSIDGLNHYILDDPMAFSMDFRGMESGLVMRQWLPIQLIKQNQMQVHTKDILTMAEPNEEFIDYYVYTVGKIKSVLNAKELAKEMTDEELQLAINDFQDIQYDGIGVLH